MRWFIILVILAGIAVGVSCCVVVDQTEYVVVKRFGDPIQVLLEPGLKFKAPWPIDVPVRIDNRLIVQENPGAGEADKEYLTRDVQAGIGKNVLVTTYTCWRVKRDADSVLRFIQTMGDRTSAETQLGDVVVSELGATLGNHDFSKFVSVNEEDRNWSGLLDEILQRCKDRVEGEYGIEIIDIKIERLNFPVQNRRPVFDRMRAERETIASRYRSEGDQEAATIRARANRQRDEILAEAEKQATQIRGHADAEAARIYAEAYGKDPWFYEFLRTLETYEKTFDEGTVLILSADSDFLRLLNQEIELPTIDGQEPTLESLRLPTTQPAAGD